MSYGLSGGAARARSLRTLAGLVDAMLAQVVDETSPDRLLDTYQEERHPVAARALGLSWAS